jgi:type VI secretion system secreted protein VgrG
MRTLGTSTFSMTSPLGQDALVPTRFSLEETLSEPFRCIIDVVSEHKSIDPEKMLHQPVCVSVWQFENLKREVQGLVQQFASLGPLGGGIAYGYRLEIVPPLWFLSQTEDCRVFENKTTQEIVETIFREHAIRFIFRTDPGVARQFTMQYNESDLDFISRLLQEEGWFYFFNNQKCTVGPDETSVSAGAVVVSDRVTSFAKTEPATVAPDCHHSGEMLTNWEPAIATSLGSIRSDDYDPDHPGSALSASTTTQREISGSTSRHAYHWPAHTLLGDVANLRTRRRMESAEAQAMLSRGAGEDPGFTPGGRFKVFDHNGSRPFVLYAVSHQAGDETWRNGQDSPSYSNTFTAFPAGLRWRPARTVQRPRMAGIYSATVTDDPDALGRINVRFRWDYRSDSTPTGGVRVRVMEAWGGANAGTCFIPRVGTEVAVSFLDGDPDRPVVIGQLRNDKERPPWPLPENKTRSGLRTRSSSNGGSEQFSELWFDDKNGEEQVMLHAERDLTIEAENDATHDVGRNRTVSVRKGDDKLTVEQGNRIVDVPNGSHTIKSTTGDIAIKTSAGAVSVEAMTSLTLKVGQSTVTLDQSGVTIKGMMVKIEGQVMTNLKGPMLQLDADGMLKAAGGIMMLN